MNKDILKGKLEQVKGEVQKEWGKLTDNDLDLMGGDVKILLGKLQENYGLTLEEAKKRLEEYQQRKQ